MSFSEITEFLAAEQRDHVKLATCTTICQLTGTKEGLQMISSESELLEALIKLVKTSNSFVYKLAMKVLVNVSAEEFGTNALLDLQNIDLVSLLLECIQDENNEHSDYACAILANMTRNKSACDRVLQKLQGSDLKIEGLVFILCQIGFNKKGANLNLLAAVIQNFTQIKDGRRHILNKSKCIFERLLPFINYNQSIGRRKSIIAAIHNCCFEKDHHQWLISDDIDIIGYLLHPLAGPDVFTEEENNSFPLDLQYLSSDKTREDDSEIRCLLLESLFQLCAKRDNRESLRQLNVYLILREHHKWEVDKKCIMLNEDIVNILIRTEEEIGEEDISNLDVPEDMAQKFSKLDEEFLMEETKKLGS